MSRIIIKTAILGGLILSFTGCAWIGYGNKGGNTDTQARDLAIKSHYTQYAQLELVGEISKITTHTHFHHTVQYEIHLNESLPSGVANVSYSTAVSAHADALAPYTITIEQDFAPAPQIGQHVCKPSGSLYFGYC